MRRINKVAVLGSGIMGSGIACHLANAGLEVLMLDLPSKEGPRNAIAEKALTAAVKSKPAPLYKKSFASRITTGNFEDDMPKVKDCDWIIEVVVEKLDIKKIIFDQVEAHRKPGSLITSNTSGIPIRLMNEGRTKDFQENFCGTHFFNPVRYMSLLEIIPTSETKEDVIDFFMHFGSNILGKKTVLCKDTPAFIANRVGVYAMAKIIDLTGKLGLSLTEVDKLTGSAIGRPGTGTFRLADLVGLDTAAKVIEGVQNLCPQDEQMPSLPIPAYLKFLLEAGHYGNKSGKGFYQKTKEKDSKGRSVILELDLATQSYQPTQKPNLESLKVSKQIDDVRQRIKFIYNHDDKGGQLIRDSLSGLFSYAAHRVFEIADNIYSIDDALRAGFGWSLGAFEYWDVIGLDEGIEAAKNLGYTFPEWIKTMQEKGIDSFYRYHKGVKQFYDPKQEQYRDLENVKGFIILDALRNQKPVFENDELSVHDIGDQVLCAEFRSKSNAIGGGILQGLIDTIQLAEEGDWRGLVIGNNDKNFTVGANLMLIGMMAFQKQWDELDRAVRLFQNTTMRCRYSSIPVIAATQGYVFGGGCETIMHCDKAVAAAESYIGLVEVGVGLIPGGSGTKEFAVRASDEFHPEGVQMPIIIEKLKTIAMASVATSAHEAFDMAYLNDKDEVIMNAQHNIQVAKDRVIQMSENYIQPIVRSDIQVLGRSGLATLYTAINELKLGQYATEHDLLIAKKIAYVLCGGDLSGAQKVSERYLLNLEREAFLSLCGEEKTLARIQYMLENNKPLRN